MLIGDIEEPLLHISAWQTICIFFRAGVSFLFHVYFWSYLLLLYYAIVPLTSDTCFLADIWEPRFFYCWGWGSGSVSGLLESGVLCTFRAIQSFIAFCFCFFVFLVSLYGPIYHNFILFNVLFFLFLQQFILGWSLQPSSSSNGLIDSFFLIQLDY